MDPVVEILAVTARDDGVLELVEKLDAYMQGLYPPESNHLTPPEELSAGANRFFAARVDGKLLGCGAIRVVGQDYAEIKRIFVDPSARGLGLARPEDGCMADAITSVSTFSRTIGCCEAVCKK